MGYWVIIPPNKVRNYHKSTVNKYGMKTYKSKAEAERVAKTF